jgi:RAB protein geranylgeranyltransferase component A
MSDTCLFPLLDDPAEFEVVLLGTGPILSLVAAAAAQIGKRVLHLDTNTYYGAHAASLNIKQLITSTSTRGGGGEMFATHQHTYTQYQLLWNHIQPNRYREYAIDRTERLIFANGPLVNLLIKSNSTEYFLFAMAEDQFYAVQEPSGFVKLPVSKSEIFQSKFLSLVEKRQLMKFVHQLVGAEERFANLPSNKAADADAQKSYDRNLPFQNVIEEQGFSRQVADMLVYGLCNDLYPQQTNDSPSDQTLKTGAALDFFSAYIRSFQRFGQGSFLYPLYGLGSIPEMMCRKAAVYNAIYILSAEPKLSLNPDSGALEGVILPSGQIAKSNLFIFDTEYVSSDYHPFEFEHYSRCILITNLPIQNAPYSSDARNKCSTFVIPSNHHALSNKNPIRIVQLDHTTKTCPKDSFVIHIKSLMSEDPEQDLSRVVSYLFPDQSSSDDEKDPENSPLLLKLFYKERHPTESSIANLRSRLPSGVHCCSEQYSGLSDIEMISRAEQIFTKLFPGEEFFPAVESQRPTDEENFDILSQVSIPK